MTAPEREALVKALRVVLSASRPDFQWHPSEQANAIAWFEAMATVRNGLDEIKYALSDAPAVTVTEERHLEDVLKDAMIGEPFLHKCVWCVTKDDALAGMTAMLSSPRKNERDGDRIRELERALNGLVEIAKCWEIIDDRKMIQLDNSETYQEAIRALKSTTPQTGSQE